MRVRATTFSLMVTEEFDPWCVSPIQFNYYRLKEGDYKIQMDL